MITKDEARVLILQEWGQWIEKHPEKTNPNGTDGLIFSDICKRSVLHS